jgi:hypothetical protein
MLLAAERARFPEGNLGIQGLMAGIVGGNAPVIEYLEIRTLKHFVLIRADKYEFHFLCIRHFKSLKDRECSNGLSRSQGRKITRGRFGDVRLGMISAQGFD